MAEIEDGQNADSAKAREWRNRAQSAPRDPQWTADGITSDEWEPLSPVNGKLDAFEWRVPSGTIAARTAAPASTALVPSKLPPAASTTAVVEPERLPPDVPRT